MAHFAKTDSNNVVQQVIVVKNDVLLDSEGNESEQLGIDFCKSLYGQDTTWIQTSYNGNMRARYAGVGMSYDALNNVFITEQPFPSWTLNTTNDWVSPLANNPSSGSGDYGAVWQEDNQRWIAFRAEGQENPDVWNPSTQQWDLV